MKRIAQFWLPTLLLVFYLGKVVETQRYSFENGHNAISKLFPYPLQQRFESSEGSETHGTRDDLQRLLALAEKNIGKEKRTNNEIVDTRESNQNLNEQFEKLLQNIANKLKEIPITPRLGRNMDDTIECQRSRPPFAPRLGKKSANPLTPRMGRQAYDDTKC